MRKRRRSGGSSSNQRCLGAGGRSSLPAQASAAAMSSGVSCSCGCDARALAACLRSGNGAGPSGSTRKCGCSASSAQLASTSSDDAIAIRRARAFGDARPKSKLRRSVLRLTTSTTSRSTRLPWQLPKIQVGSVGSGSFADWLPSSAATMRSTSASRISPQPRSTTRMGGLSDAARAVPCVASASQKVAESASRSGCFRARRCGRLRGLPREARLEAPAIGAFLDDLAGSRSCGWALWTSLRVASDG